jgi:triosephosphate isomerase
MCNLKSNKTLTEILDYKKALKNSNLKTKEFVLFPTSIYLPFFYDANYSLGTQNISIYDEGSHTGEILASQLASLKVKYALINHCEMNERGEDIIRKIKNAFKYHIKVVLCFGKDISKDCLIAINEIQIQIKKIFDYLTRDEIENIIIAFEPAYLVQSSEIIDIKNLLEIASKIKAYLKDNYNIVLPFIYGGGITDTNFHKLLNLDIIDGFLVGNWAINPENILEMTKYV